MNIELIERIIQLGGLFHLGIGIFHITFPKFFQWNKTLKRLDKRNFALMHVLHFCLMLLFFLFAFSQFAFAADYISSSLGKFLLFAFGLFWSTRAFLQIRYFKLNHKLSMAFFVIFLLGATLFLIPFYSSMHPTRSRIETTKTLPE